MRDLGRALKEAERELQCCVKVVEAVERGQEGDLETLKLAMESAERRLAKLQRHMNGG